ncbi:MAG: hypothetical protein PWP23_1814 [Candidatus Sumerlaeota bacterium]|nr:hypothetical protein [Candidatus Sumerlaeota bacterium]
MTVLPRHGLPHGASGAVEDLQARIAARAARTTIALTALALFAYVLATGTQLGMCWDEGLYYPAYRDVASWARTLLLSPGEALSGEGIRAGWESVHEFPPLVKWLGALTLGLAPRGHALLAMRTVPAALFAATVLMLYVLARRRVGHPWSCVVAAGYALHPRLLGHAHFAASETVMAFLTVLALWVAAGDLEKWGRRLALAAVGGLALAAKVNGLILVVALVAWLLLRPWMGRSSGHCWKRDALTALLVAALGPLLALAIWPWMWDETGARLWEYWQFIREHAHYGVWYLGEKWVLPPGNGEPVPWHYPLVMTLVASPVAWSLLALAGVAGVARVAWREKRLGEFDLLLLLLAAGPFAAAMLPSSPRYDGVRLFFPAFVPLTLLAARMPEALPVRWKEALLAPKPSSRTMAVCAGVALLLAEGFLPGARPGLGFYNLPVRLAAKSGTEFPFETTYWTERATPKVFDDITAFLGTEELRIKTLALDGVVFDIQQEWGHIPAGIQFNGEPPYDAHLMQNRKGFWSRTEWWFAANREPLLVWPPGSENPDFYLFDGRPPGVR